MVTNGVPHEKGFCEATRASAVLSVDPGAYSFGPIRSTGLISDDRLPVALDQQRTPRRPAADRLLRRNSAHVAE